MHPLLPLIRPRLSSTLGSGTAGRRDINKRGSELEKARAVSRLVLASELALVSRCELPFLFV